MAGTMSGGMPPPAPGWGPPPAAPMKRPVGVTILAVLTILFGVLGLLGGLLLLVGAALIATVFPQYAGVVGLIVAFAAILTLVSIISIVAGVGLLRLRKWAWWLTIIVSILNIVVSIGTYAVYPVGGFPFGIILWIIIDLPRHRAATLWNGQPQAGWTHGDVGRSDADRGWRKPLYQPVSSAGGPGRSHGLHSF